MKRFQAFGNYSIWISLWRKYELKFEISKRELETVKKLISPKSMNKVAEPWSRASFNRKPDHKAGDQ